MFEENEESLKSLKNGFLGKMKFGELSNKVIGCAIEVHRVLCAGLLESTYEQCLAHELSLNNIEFKLQHPFPINYKGIKLDCGYKADILVEDETILELKSVDKLNRVHNRYAIIIS